MGQKVECGDAAPSRGCINSQGAAAVVQQNFQHLPKHVMNANMKRRGRKKTKTIGKSGGPRETQTLGVAGK